MKYFNTAGPVRPEDHYTLDLLYFDSVEKYHLQTIFFILFISFFFGILLFNYLSEIKLKISFKNNIFNKISFYIDKLKDGIRLFYKNPLSAIIILSIAIITQCGGILSLYCFAKASSLNISILSIGWIFGVIGIIQLLPFFFSGIGIREASYAFFLKEFGVSYNQSVTFGVSLYIFFFVNIFIGILLYNLKKDN